MMQILQLLFICIIGGSIAETTLPFTKLVTTTRPFPAYVGKSPVEVLLTATQQGSTVTLTCVCDRGDPAVTLYTFYRNNRYVKSGPGSLSSSGGVHTFTLSEETTGRYKCHAATDFGPEGESGVVVVSLARDATPSQIPDKQFTSLPLLTTPRGFGLPEHQKPLSVKLEVLTSGSKVTLQCVSDRVDPYVTRFTFYKHGEEVDSGPGQNSGRRYTFDSSPDTTGRYKCDVESDFGATGESNYVVVEEAHDEPMAADPELTTMPSTVLSPEPTPVPNLDVTLTASRKGSVVTLECIADRVDPFVTLYTFYLNGDRINSGPGIYPGRLYDFTLSANTAGKYTCDVSSDFGADGVSNEVVVSQTKYHRLRRRRSLERVQHQ